MRIIFVTSKLDFERSGASVTELDLKVRTVKELGGEPRVITTFPGANRITENLPYEVIEEDIKSKRLLSLQFGIYEILKKYSKEADIFHIDGHLFLYGAGFYRLLGGDVPVVAHFNRELMCWPENVSAFLNQSEDNIIIEMKKKIRRSIEKYGGIPAASYINLPTFANPFLQKTYENFGLNNRSNFMAGDCFDHEKTMRENDVTQSHYLNRNKSDGVLTVFYTGRMVPGNGFDTLILAFSKIVCKDRYKLILGGAGGEGQALKKMAQDLGVDKYIDFLGWVSREDVYNNFKNADIFVRPKCMRLEFNSNTLREAMAFGLPCIVPQGGALAWGARESALNYRDEDADDLAQKIEELGDNPQLREKLSRNCYLRLSDSEMDYKKKVPELYEKMRALLNEH